MSESIFSERSHALPRTVGDALTLGDASALRVTWRLEGKRVLLTVGCMDARKRYKGHDLVIQAVSRFVSADCDVIRVMLGIEDRLDQIESAAVGLGVAEIARVMDDVSLETPIDASDIFVIASTDEGFGVPFLEAMACGTPALGLATAGAKDALADGELGAALEDGELADALGDLLQAPRRDPHELEVAIRGRFGRRAFADNVCKAMRRLFQLPLRLSVPTAEA
jgi:phosphatidylinositol alpha-1,6-mannosyltransferase